MAMREPGAGELNRRALIRKWEDVPNAAFGLDQTFDAGFACWASVEPIGGATYYGAKQTGDQVTHRIIVRRVAGKTDPASVTAEHVVEIGGMRYRVRRVTDMNDGRRFTAIEAEELGAI